MTRFLLCTLLLFLLPATAVLAQNTGKLSGRVVDDLGDPLPGANVIIDGAKLGAATDINGNYFIIGVPVGHYNVTASFVGFESQTIEGVAVSSGYTTEQNFELSSDTTLCWIPVCTDCWERGPLISRDPFASRRISGEEIEHLPVGR